jgi:Bacterial SH3 domain
MHVSLTRFSLCFAFMNALVWSTPGYAASCDVPAGYYRVVDFGTGEAIQLRAKPSHSSMLMGTLNNDEVVFSDGTRDEGSYLTWQRIRQNQVEGWVAARHLWRALPMTLAKTDLPAVGYCGASSPPWGLRWDDHSVRMSLFPGKHEFAVQSVQSGVSPGSVLVTGSAPEAAMTFVYSDEICHGAGNATVSWGSAYIVIRQNGEERLYKGCCNPLRTAFTNR